MPGRGPGDLADELEFDTNEAERWLCGAEAGGEPEADGREGRPV